MVVGRRNSEDSQEILNILRSEFLPNKVVLFVESSDLASTTGILPDFVKDYTMINDKATVYVCENFSCQQPTNDVKKVLDLLAISR